MLAAEMVAALATIWVADVWGSAQHHGTPALPKPEQIMGAVLLYAALAAVAMFGPQPARLAAGVGGLALLAVVVKGAGGVFSALGAPPQPVAGVAGNPNPKGVKAI